MAAPKGNKFALGNNGGCPPKYSSRQELIDKISEYFDQCVPEYDEEGNVLAFNNPTVTGIALYLGFASRQSFYDYKDSQEFSDIIKRASMVIENHYEEKLNHQSPTGAIFALKNMGWADKQEITNNNIDINKIADISDDELDAKLARLDKILND